ncbi:MAG: hypothetical protein ACOCXG_04910 [Nanoarchaeota archaeon]
MAKSFDRINYLNNKKFGFLDVTLDAEQSEGEVWGIKSIKILIF